jgi:hypothetical protein
VTAVTYVLPRLWDGRRLLRFLTGLAMIALAFTVHVTPPAPAHSAERPAVAVAVAQAGPTSGQASSEAPAPASEPAASLPALPPATAPVLGLAVLLLLVGRFFSVRGERAPPVV